MPPVLIAFFLLVGTTVPHVIGGLDPRVDKLARARFGEPAQGYLTRLSASALWEVAKTDSLGHESCRAVAFATVRGGHTARAVIDGVDKGLDWTWSHEVEAAPGMRRVVVTRYIDPADGHELACHEAFFNCVPSRGWDGRINATLSHDSAPCRPAPAGVDKHIKQTGAARLVLKEPSRVMPNRFVTASNGETVAIGVVMFQAEIHGEMNEEWYCPRVEWEIPQVPGHSPAITTKASEESDCAPWVPGGPAERRFTKRLALPEGEWFVTVRLFHGSQFLAEKTGRAVVGSEGAQFDGSPERGIQ